MPYYRATEPIAAQALNLLADEPRRSAMKADLDAVVRSLGTRSAALETAKMAVELIEKQ